MEVVDVIPIGKSFGKETFSYFSSKKVELGSIVEIPLRKKTGLAVVIAKHPLAKVKAALKSADFTLRNVQTVYQKTPFRPDFLRTCIQLKNYSLASLPTLLSVYTPALVMEDESLWHEHESLRDSEDYSNILPEKYVLQTNYRERISYYKTSIREQFAAKCSVVMVAPVRAQVERLHADISKGIERHVFFLHSGLGKKKIRETLALIAQHDRPCVVIVSPLYVGHVQRDDIQTYIVEFESSRHYVSQQAPYQDDRIFISAYAHVRGANILYSDDIARFATIFDLEEKNIYPAKPFSFRMKIGTPTTLGTWKKSEDVKQEFTSITEKLRDVLATAITANQNTLLYVRRKGLAPVTVCQDCGEVVRNPLTQTPLALFKRKSADTGEIVRIHVDPKTNESFPASDECVSCGGWRLTQLGIGTDRVEADIKKILPKASVYILDATTAPTYSKTIALLKGWRETPGSILIATEKILAYLDESVAHIAVISLESLLAIPAYDIQERVLYTLATLGSAAEYTFLIQSKDPENPLVQACVKKNFNDVYHSDLADRKRFLFPPAGVLVRIRTQATEKNLRGRKKLLETLYQEFSPVTTIVPSRKKGAFDVSAEIRLAANEWYPLAGPKKQLTDTYKRIFLLSQDLPPGYWVSVER